MLPQSMETLWDLCPNSSPQVVSLHPTHHSLHSSWVPVQALPAQALSFSLKFLICKMAIGPLVGQVYWETCWGSQM